MKPLKDIVLDNDLLVVAHRGSSGTAPENTLAAFREAVTAGVHMIETDIQFTTDDKIIAFHDYSLHRTAQGSESDQDFSYDQIRKIDIGSWMSPRFAGERIPLLEEVIALVKGKANLMLEVKTRRTATDDSSLKSLLKMIYDYDFEKNVVFGSFNYPLLSRIKHLDKSLPVAAIHHPGADTLPSVLASEFGASAFICEFSELSERFIEDAMLHTIFTGVYSIDNQKDLQEVLNYPVQAIATNFPAKIISYLKEHKKNQD